jgi:magnesium chelatase subunit D
VPSGEGSAPAGQPPGAKDERGEGPGRDQGGPLTLPVGATFDPLRLELGKGRAREAEGRHLPGRRSPVRDLGGGQGAHVGDQVPPGRVARASDVALSGTLRAAAPSQLARGRWPGGPVMVRPADLRTKVREGREGNLVLFVVDASGSMAARRRMSAVKGAVLSLLLDAYQRRDRVGLVTFAGEGAELAVPPTASVDLAARLLAELPTGGRTPLAAGLGRAAEVLAAERVRDPLRRPLLVLVTDGRATGPRGAGTAGVDAAVAAGAALAARGVPGVLVDTEEGPVRLGLGGRVAAAMGAPWLRLEELAASSLAGLVRRLTAPGGRAA